MTLSHIMNSKIFLNSEHIVRSLFKVHVREFNKEVERIDVKPRKLINVKIIKSTLDPTILKLQGDIIFDKDEFISTSSVITLGYNAGKTCEISFHYKSNYSNKSHITNRTSTYVVMGYMTFAKPRCISNGFCKKIDVTIDIPYEDNIDINHVECYLHNLTSTSKITFKCTPPRILAYNTEDSAQMGLSNLWSSDMGNAILSQLVINYTTDLIPKCNGFCQTPEYIDFLDIRQSQLVATICSENLIITCDAPVGSGKTQSIASAVLTGIKNGKTFLIVGPTNKSCDAFLERLNSWRPYSSDVLLLRSKSSFVRYPDIYKKSELYYFREGLTNFLNDMDERDRQIYMDYENFKTTYCNLKCDPSATWTKEYIDKLNRSTLNLSIAESKLPRLIMKYVSPKIFVSTIDYAIRKSNTPYFENTIDYIIMDESSQVRTSTALILLSKFPSSKICYLGDINQLPPFDLHITALDDYDQILNLPILDLMKHNDFAKNLNLPYNYRSHPQIVELFSEIFYDRTLQPMIKDDCISFKNISFQRGVSKKSPDYRKYFPFYAFHISHPSKRHFTGSTYNQGEANNISILLFYLLNAGFNPDNIAVICLYKAQVNTVRKTFFDLLSKYCNRQCTSDFLYSLTNTREKLFHLQQSLLIDTVDAFQGQEKDYVIISTTRSKARSDDLITDFYELRNRLCVALTRSKLGFFLFGDINMMNDSQSWSSIVEYMNMRNTVKTFDVTTLNKIFKHKTPNLKFILGVMNKNNYTT